jgi:hypothetical protein
MNVFLYGVGFVSCCVTLVYCILGILHGPGGVSIKSILWYFYIFPFTFLYYSYATLLQSSEKGIDRVTLYLAAMFFISAAVLTIIEIMLYGIPFAGFFLLLFGLYCAYCLIRKKGILSIQVFAWTPFLPTFIIFWSAFITRLLTTSII